MAEAKKSRKTPVAAKGKVDSRKPSPAKPKVGKLPVKKVALKPVAKKAPAKKAKSATRQLLDSKGVSAAIEQLVQDVYREFPDPSGLVILGVRTRGAVIAERMKERLDEKYGILVGLGSLDITFYRDDLSRLGPDPMVRETTMPFDIDGANVVLVDDVLYTGRTIRAAIDEICDFGRPALIRLAVLVDRGLREYPIHADFCALKVQTAQEQVIHVNLEETDDADEVVLAPKE